MNDRFVYDGLYPAHYSSHITDKETGKTYLIKGIVELLNEQDKEIKRLKCMNNQLERRLDYSIAYDMGECE